MSVAIDLFKSNYKILKSWYIIFYLLHIHFIPHPFLLSFDLIKSIPLIIIVWYSVITLPLRYSLYHCSF